MILADIGQYQALKGYVINLTQKVLKSKMADNKHNLKDFYDMYTEEQIESAIANGIRRTGNKIFMQTDGLTGRILRSLEFGTGRTKALHLVTSAVRTVIGGRI